MQTTALKGGLQGLCPSCTPGSCQEQVHVDWSKGGGFVQTSFFVMNQKAGF